MWIAGIPEDDHGQNGSAHTAERTENDDNSQPGDEIGRDSSLEYATVHYYGRRK